MPHCIPPQCTTVATPGQAITLMAAATHHSRPGQKCTSHQDGETLTRQRPASERRHQQPAIGNKTQHSQAETALQQPEPTKDKQLSTPPLHCTDANRNQTTTVSASLACPKGATDFSYIHPAGINSANDKTKAKEDMQAPQAGRNGALLRSVKVKGHIFFLHSNESNQIPVQICKRTKHKGNRSKKPTRP